MQNNQGTIKKCAIFAEGGTEQAFLRELLIAIAGANNIQIETRKRAGRVGNRAEKIIRIDAASPTQKYYALIIDCSGDHGVKADIREQYKGLVAEGYSAIIGLRDVRPLSIADIPKLRAALDLGLETNPIKPAIILSIMEIEAWFIGENEHFAKIHPDLTHSRVNRIIGFDPSVDPAKVESLPQPTEMLDQIYKLEGKRYDKTPPSTIERTIAALNYGRVHQSLSRSIPALGLLVNEINAFLS
jgi:hypothetical protein